MLQLCPSAWIPIIPVVWIGHKLRKREAESLRAGVVIRPQQTFVQNLGAGMEGRRAVCCWGGSLDPPSCRGSGKEKLLSQTGKLSLLTGSDLVTQESGAGLSGSAAVILAPAWRGHF